MVTRGKDPAADEEISFLPNGTSTNPKMNPTKNPKMNKQENPPDGPGNGDMVDRARFSPIVRLSLLDVIEVPLTDEEYHEFLVKTDHQISNTEVSPP